MNWLFFKSLIEWPSVCNDFSDLRVFSAPLLGKMVNWFWNMKPEVIAVWFKGEKKNDECCRFVQLSCGSSSISAPGKMSESLSQQCNFGGNLKRKRLCTSLTSPFLWLTCCETALLLPLSVVGIFMRIVCFSQFFENRLTGLTFDLSSGEIFIFGSGWGGGEVCF